VKDTKWKQDFFEKVEPITMVDPLSSVLGAVADNEPIYYTYADCVKVAGHACASVSSAFQMTKLALKALYGDETPVRGGVTVRFGGDRTSGANGPIGQVIQFITGAAIETGFHGLAGRYSRADKFTYDEGLGEEFPNGIAATFTRNDTQKTVTVVADPSVIPLTQEERAGAAYMPNVVSGRATGEEREKFYAFWQGKNRKILLEEHGAFKVTPS
jgi:hypothetical protein